MDASLERYYSEAIETIESIIDDMQKDAELMAATSSFKSCLNQPPL